MCNGRSRGSRPAGARISHSLDGHACMHDSTARPPIFMLFRVVDELCALQRYVLPQKKPLFLKRHVVSHFEMSAKAAGTPIGVDTTRFEEHHGEVKDAFGRSGMC